MKACVLSHAYPCNFLLLLQGRTIKRGRVGLEPTCLDGPATPSLRPWRPPWLPSRVLAAPPPTRTPGRVWGYTRLTIRTHVRGGRLRPRHPQTRSREHGGGPQGEEPAVGCLPCEGPGTVIRTRERSGSSLLSGRALLLRDRGPWGRNGNCFSSSATSRTYTRDLPQRSTSRGTGG